MKILLYEWNGYGQKDLRETLAMLGHKVDRIGYVFKNICEDGFFEEKLLQRLKKGYDIVMSFNFFPVVAKCCREMGIPYLLWIYDGEDMGLYHKNALFDTNYIFTFDSAMLKRLKAKGISQAWYLPLGVNVRRLDAIPYLAAEEQKFQCEISFIGNLYQNKQSLDSITHSDYIKGYLEGMIRAQLRINFCSLLDELMTPELAGLISIENSVKVDSRYNIRQEELMHHLLATSATQRERYLIMKKLSDTYPVDLYTYSRTEDLPKIRNRGVAGYFNEMPRVFRYSKINLNITHRMIRTGIPLRVMDVLGAGGFLMSNYQQDMGEDFRDGEHLVIYYNEDDLLEKIGFYLSRKEERKRIARNGCELVHQKYTMENLLAKMFHMAGITK